MEQADISITRLKDELKQSHYHINNLLKERDALKQAYSMQIDLVKGLEEKIHSLQTKLNQVQ